MLLNSIRRTTRKLRFYGTKLYATSRNE